MKIDFYLLFLLAAVGLATILPCHGYSAVILAFITKAAIFLLFFLHGAKLSRQAVFSGAGHWRLHLLVLTSTFFLFPLLGLALSALSGEWIEPTIQQGLLFLCLLPSTVQSSIAFTSIARGNVPAAVCSATLSNIVGIFVTPLFVGLTIGVRNAGPGVDLNAFTSIAVQLLLPFVLGHLSRPLTAALIHRQKAVVNLVDRGSILLVVYTAFSGAVVGGIWSRLAPSDIALILVLDALLLTVVLVATTVSARVLRFSKEDEIAIVFCGSKKSLASGVPMAGVLLSPATFGALIVPLMLFHQMQLMICAVLARRYAARETDVSSVQTPDTATAYGASWCELLDVILAQD